MSHVHTIVPPHIYRNILEHGDARLRARALRSLTIRARFWGHREILSQVNLAVPVGERYRSVFDAKEGRRLPGTLVRNEGDAPTGDARVNAVYDNLGLFYDFFHDVYGRNSLDNQGQRLIATVHYETDFDNAFFDGRQIVFGDGDGVVFQGFTRSLDVIGHELAHGVIQNASRLRYQDQPGALNESLADIFGSLFKQYQQNQDAESADWLIGSDLFVSGLKGRGLRSLKEPGGAYDDPLLGKDPQPGHFRNYVNVNEDGGGVHVNSGIPNRAFYLVAKQLGGYAWEEAGRIWYEALHRLQAETEFQDAAQITYQVAGELFGPASAQQHAVQNGWEEVGVRVQVRAGRLRAVASQSASSSAAHGRTEARTQTNGNGKHGTEDLEGIKKTLEVIRQRVEVLTPVAN